MFDLQRYALREAAVTSAVIGVASAGAQIASGISNTKKAKDAINDFNRQELQNPFENIQISTLKADQQTEANNVNLASSVSALQRGGTRAVLGGIPRINQQNVLLQNLISADLDRQDKERQRLIAQQDTRIQGIQENRENQALQGLGQQLQTGRQDTFSGLTNLASAGLALGSATSQGGSSTSQGGQTSTTGFGFRQSSFASNPNDASLFNDFNSTLS